MNLKILLVIPPIKWSLRSDFTRGPHSPHIGIACLAGILKRRGIKVRILDGQATRLTKKSFAQSLLAFQPTAVGFTSPTHQIFDAHALAQVSKQVLPQTPVLIGGYHANALPTETLREFPSFDIAIYGEGEETLVEILYSDWTKHALSNISGLAYRDGEEIIKTDARSYLTDLSILDFPAFELFPLSHGTYRPYFTRQTLVELPIFLSRGCPYNCAFCFRSVGQKLRLRSTESVLAEIERDIKDFGCQQLLFTDDTFTLHKEKVSKLCESILRKGLHRKVQWVCETRIDSVDRNLLSLMKKANCVYISYGIESGNQGILDKQQKRISLSQIKEVIKVTQRAGIQVHTNFILGHPGETKETARQTIALALECNPNSATFGIMVPFPGTDIWTRALAGKNGLRLLTKNWRHYGTQIGGALELDTLSRPQLEALQRQAYFRFLFRRGKIGTGLSSANLSALLPFFFNQIANQMTHLRRSSSSGT